STASCTTTARCGWCSTPTRSCRPRRSRPCRAWGPSVAESTIIVAHESETIREAIRHLCADAGYAVRTVGDGAAALEMLALRPAALVLDVALPVVHAYEVVEAVRKETPDTRVVLVASIYNRTGYKRRPTSLYGADDYVEQHHIPDALL